MTDTRSYEDVSTDPPEAQGRPSDLVKDDLPDADLAVSTPSSWMISDCWRTSRKR